MVLLTTLRTGATRTALRNVASSSSSSSATSSSTRIAPLAAPLQRRELHYLPPAPEAVARNGCMPFLSKGTIDTLWNGWQNGLLERLNAEVRGTELESSTLVDTVIQSSQKPERIMAFNYASQALNNAFFLNHLVADAQASQDLADNSWQDRSPPQPKGTFKAMLDSHFGSVTDFKSAFSAAALGMSSSGWVWLVIDGQGKLGIVPTFGAGTVLVQNRLQRGLPDIETNAATESPDGSAAPASSPDSHLNESGGALASSSRSLRTGGDPAQAGRVMHPLLCLSVHEHAWMPDWGIWGKENYLMRFWEVVNWNKVARVREMYMECNYIS